MMVSPAVAVVLLAVTVPPVKALMLMAYVGGGVCPLIVITNVPVMPEPSFADALTVTVPLAIAVSKPVALMLALPVPATTDHVMDWFVAVVGRTAADICNVPPLAVMVVAPPAPVTVMDVTDTGTADVAVAIPALCCAVPAL